VGLDYFASEKVQTRTNFDNFVSEKIRAGCRPEKLAGQKVMMIEELLGPRGIRSRLRG